MWWTIGVLAVIGVLGVLLERRRRASGSTGSFSGEAPYGAESAAARNQRNIGPTGGTGI
ncbi:hypothetical protein G7075_15345 [Phycicoccus sp. HDW14]|uniref:hypothetical protein n=1 Tax=Phycicoccus sp. HDW14 TaxID=2714941 RepID=UPI001408FE8A|nr:hypothetical protein [Phycicoccus sp. HDW14]QIM22192.1 hypothetical protein G7075_15345 [Phycicoccus sp. HDW14]